MRTRIHCLTQNRVFSSLLNCCTAPSLQFPSLSLFFLLYCIYHCFGFFLVAVPFSFYRFCFFLRSFSQSLSVFLLSLSLSLSFSFLGCFLTSSFLFICLFLIQFFSYRFSHGGLLMFLWFLLQCICSVFPCINLYFFFFVSR